MRNRLWLFGASCLAIAACNRAAAETTEASAPAQVDEVVVTATRRSESIIKVPTAISAYDTSRLREEQIVALSDLTARTPNVQISSFSDKANITIRGIGNGNLTQAGGEPGVAVSSDGVYLGQSILALTSFLDLSRVEVLRGPQGTLFGRNATGGAVNLIPNLPTATASYGADLSFGVDPTLVRSTGFVSGPLSADGALLARIAFTQNYNEGFTRNLASSSPFHLDGVNNAAVRGQLQWKPSDGFDVRLLAEYQTIDDPGPASFLLGNPANIPYVTPFGPAPIQGANAGDPEHREIYVTHGQRNLDSSTVNLTTNWSIGGGNLKALASYNRTTQRNEFDGDGTVVDFTSSKFRDSVNQYYAEAIYTSDPAEAFTYTLGANYYHEHLTQYIQVPHSQITQLLGITFTAFGTVETESYAAFGHAEYVVGNFKAFGGLRYSWDEKKVPFESNNFVGVRSNASASWDKLTYEAGVSYDFSPSITGYAKYATGYKSGGYVLASGQPEFDPETNINYEVGLKGRFLDGALQANLSAFHMDYKDLQVNQVLFVTVGVTNAARATVDGVEFETVLRPTPALRIEGSGSWLDAKFDEFLTADAARPTGPGCKTDPVTKICTFDLAGNALPGAPRYTASVAVYYDVPFAKGTVTPSVRYSWKSKIYFSEFNIPISSQGSAGKLDLFLNYKSDNDRWTASLFALNATDKLVRSNVTVVSTGLASMALGKFQPGRQVGASIGYRF
jgi:iron complex outermembrane receptor protein